MAAIRPDLHGLRRWGILALPLLQGHRKNQHRSEPRCTRWCSTQRARGADSRNCLTRQTACAKSCLDTQRQAETGSSPRLYLALTPRFPTARVSLLVGKPDGGRRELQPATWDGSENRTWATERDFPLVGQAWSRDAIGNPAPAAIPRHLLIPLGPNLSAGGASVDA